MSAESVSLELPVQREPAAAASLRARVAKQILRLVTRQVPVDLVLPDGGLLNQRGGSRT
jgi:cyclopropane-fatty-acyl-phospholipid synthase